MVNKRTFKKNKIRTYTINKLEQQKYNLFREENEGYAKLITELLQGDNITESNINVLKQNIFSLIGYFDLDPYRVLEIVLTAYEFNYDNDNYITLIKQFKFSAVAPLLGNKFVIYSKLQPADTLIPYKEVM